jgi:hypothetical protein
MPDGLDAIAGKIAPFIKLLASDADGEVLAAARALRRTLTSHGLDLHALADRVVDGPPLRDDEMRAIWNQAIEWHMANEAATRAAAEPEPAGLFTSVRTVERPLEPGVNGYSWLQIAEHCAKNKHLFSGRNLEFIESIPEKIRHYGSPTLRQAKWLNDLFVQKFGGRIE